LRSLPGNESGSICTSETDVAEAQTEWTIRKFT